MLDGILYGLLKLALDILQSTNFLPGNVGNFHSRLAQGGRV